MKNLLASLSLVLVAATSSASAFAAEGAPPSAQNIYPKIEQDGGGIPKIMLGPDIEAALKKNLPGFQMFTEGDFIPDVRALFVNSTTEGMAGVIGNFTNRKENEIVVMGHDASNQIVAAVTVDKNGRISVRKVVATKYEDPRKTFYPNAPGDKPAESAPDKDRAPRQQGLFQYLSLGDKHKGFDTFQVETYYGETTRYFYDARKGTFDEFK